ncbi:MAG: Cys-tRNA(Pro) deacylase [Lachnospiraceae bacterium]|nr:Cys-tRNA(Pro) deacylase [Lachnospiraceae bacterium]
MAKKENKTNAMRILDRNKVNYQVNNYECDEFIDGMQIADKNGQAYEQSFKTLVTVGKSGGYYVFAIPVDKEIDFKKAAKIVGEKSVEMIHVKDINAVTGYIRGGCTPLGMKKLYPTVIEESAQNFDEIIISGGKLGVQIIMNPLDLAKVVNGRFANVIVSISEE